MTNSEFSNEFDVLYNNITSNQAPGLDEYEKSVFLTKAQTEILKSYFLNTSNKSGAGFDGNQKRQIDFSTITRVTNYCMIDIYNTSKLLDYVNRVSLPEGDGLLVYIDTSSKTFSGHIQLYETMPYKTINNRVGYYINCQRVVDSEGNLTYTFIRQEAARYHLQSIGTGDKGKYIFLPFLKGKTINDLIKLIQDTNQDGSSILPRYFRNDTWHKDWMYPNLIEEFPDYKEGSYNWRYNIDDSLITINGRKEESTQHTVPSTLVVAAICAKFAGVVKNLITTINPPDPQADIQLKVKYTQDSAKVRDNIDSVINSLNTIFSFPRVIGRESVEELVPYNGIINGSSDLRGNCVQVPLPKDALFLVNESLVVERTIHGITEWKQLQINPIDYREYTRLMVKPYKCPNKFAAWRLVQSTENSAIISGAQVNLDIIPNWGDKPRIYTARYVKMPRPIILVDLSSTGDSTLSIQEESKESSCELPKEIHQEILQRAVELAKASWTGDLNSMVQLGGASQTNIGYAAQPQQARQ